MKPFRLHHLPILIAAVLFFTSCKNKRAECNDGECHPQHRDSAITQADSSSAKSLLRRDSIGKTENASEKSREVIPATALNGTVYYNLSYCGGIEPSAEMMADFQQYRLLRNSVFRLKNKTGTYEINTDENGNFTATLPAGNYRFSLVKTGSEVQEEKNRGCVICSEAGGPYRSAATIP